MLCVNTKKELTDYYVGTGRLNDSNNLVWSVDLKMRKVRVDVSTKFIKSLCWGALGNTAYSQGVKLLLGNYQKKKSSLYKFAELSYKFKNTEFKIILDFINQSPSYIKFSHDYVGAEDAYLQIYGTIKQETQDLICTNLLFAVLRHVGATDHYAETIDYFLKHYKTRRNF